MIPGKGKNMKVIRNHWFLGLILVLAGALRLWGINFGLPDSYHGDEQGMILFSFYGLTHGLALNNVAG